MAAGDGMLFYLISISVADYRKTWKGEIIEYDIKKDIRY